MAPYVKRYGAGFVDLPSLTTPVDQLFLNAVESALLQLLGDTPAVDEVGIWSAAGGGALVYGKIANAQIAAGAAIDKSKLAALNITNADIAAGAAIAKSKLAALGIVNADVDAAAAISASKIAGTMTLIDDLTVTGSVLASYDTNTRLGGNIPSTYKHLKLLVSARSDAAALVANLLLRLNNDSGANYDYQMATVQGAALATTTNANAATGAVIGRIAAATADSGRIGSAEITLNDYNGAVFHQDGRSVIGNSYLAASQVETGTSYFNWRGAQAISRIALLPNTGNFVIGSRFTLYGIS